MLHASVEFADSGGASGTHSRSTCCTHESDGRREETPSSRSRAQGARGIDSRGGVAEGSTPKSCCRGRGSRENTHECNGTAFSSDS